MLLVIDDVLEIQYVLGGTPLVDHLKLRADNGCHFTNIGQDMLIIMKPHRNKSKYSSNISITSFNSSNSTTEETKSTVNEEVIGQTVDNLSAATVTNMVDDSNQNIITRIF